jgi:hypothetical protein
MGEPLATAEAIVGLALPHALSAAIIGKATSCHRERGKVVNKMGGEGAYSDDAKSQVFVTDSSSTFHWNE